MKLNASTGKVLRKGIEPENIHEAHCVDGKLSRAEMLRCRIHYFTQGRVLGAEAFVIGLRAGANRSRGRSVAMGNGLYAPRRVAKRE